MMREGSRSARSPSPADEVASFTDSRSPAPDLRRPGGHRHRERPAVQRDERGAGAADGHGEILRVIASSPTDLQPVFDAVAEAPCGSAGPTCGRLSIRRRAAPPRAHHRSCRRCSSRGLPIPMARAGQRDCPGVLDGAIVSSGHRRGSRVRTDRVCADLRLSEILAVPLLQEGEPSGQSRLRRAGAAAVHRPAGQAARDLRRPGGDRHRERAAVQRDERGAGAADGDGGHPEGDHELADRPSAGYGRRRGERRPILRRDECRDPSPGGRASSVLSHEHGSTANPAIGARSP